MESKLKSKKRILLAAVALGVVLGAGIALTREGKSKKEEVKSAEVNSPAVTNCVAPVIANVMTNAVTNAVKAVAVTNVAVNVQPPKLPNSQTPKPSLPITTYAPNVPKARQVLLANRRIVVEKGRSFPKKFCQAQTPTARGTAPYIVISEIPVNRDVRIQAVADGAKVIGFLPNNALLVEADATALKNLEEDAMFLAAIEYEPTDKIQRALGGEIGETGEKGEIGETGEKGEIGEKGEKVREGESGEKTIEATVVLLNMSDYAAIKSYVIQNGGKVFPSAKNSIGAAIPCSLIPELAKKAEVKWIEKFARLKVHNNVAVSNALMNVSSVRPPAPLGLTGDGQILTTLDTGIYVGYGDFYPGLLGYDFSGYDESDYNGHGTHTAGSIISSGERNGGKYKGVAYGAKLWAWMGGYYGTLDVCFPCYECENGEYCVDWDITFRPTCNERHEYCRYGKEIDAHIHSGSYGGGALGGYSFTWCVPVDEYVWNHATFLPVFSAGNNGYVKSTTVEQPATAKNVLAVGASESLRPAKGTDADNAAHIASFSSCGPCEDGRIKPDIVAPGTYIMSCYSKYASRCGWDDGSETYYQYMSGTSMSCPLVAGSAALVREWLAKYREMSNPSAALVKAILMGGADDLKYFADNNVISTVPDNRQGWGRVNVGESVAPTNGVAVYLKDWLPFKQGTNFVFHVTTTNTAPLRAQLVWIDYPGEAEAGPTIVNNLDLKVSSLLGGTYHGNGGSTPDEINTVESVRIESASPATYTVTVDCPYTDIHYDYTEGGAAAIYIRGAFDPTKVIEGDMPFMFYFAMGE